MLHRTGLSLLSPESPPAVEVEVPVPPVPPAPPAPAPPTPVTVTPRFTG